MGIYLTKPNTKKESINGENENFRYAQAAMQGWRMGMEDAHITIPDIIDGVSLFAIFDGHGGPEVAKFCEKYFPNELVKNSSFIKGDYKTALEETFMKMDEILLSDKGPDLLRPFKAEPDSTLSLAGCTANVIILTKT